MSYKQTPEKKKKKDHSKQNINNNSTPRKWNKESWLWLMSCVKHSNSHREKNRGTSSVRHVFNSLPKVEKPAAMLMWCKIPLIMQSSMKWISFTFIPILLELKKWKYLIQGMPGLPFKSNSSRTILSWERKVEIAFIPSEAIPQTENGQKRKSVGIHPMFNFFNDLFFFNPSTRWTHPSSPKLLSSVWCWYTNFLFFFQTQIQFLKNYSIMWKKTGNWFHSFRSDPTT